jgi:hypothetical protein
MGRIMRKIKVSKGDLKKLELFFALLGFLSIPLSLRIAFSMIIGRNDFT